MTARRAAVVVSVLAATAAGEDPIATITVSTTAFDDYEDEYVSTGRLW